MESLIFAIGSIILAIVLLAAFYPLFFLFGLIAIAIGVIQSEATFVVIGLVYVGLGLVGARFFGRRY